MTGLIATKSSRKEGAHGGTMGSPMRNDWINRYQIKT
jgi:hypothetical protein